ncbi:MAG: glycosyltransferase family 4 protein [Desulfatitalea sp.]
MATLLTCYYRPKPGGLCTRLFRAIRALLDRGHTVHYLAVAPFPIDHPRCVFHRFPWPVAYSDTLLFWAFFHAVAPLMLLCIALRHRVTHAFAFGPTYGFFLQPLRVIMGARITCFFRADTIENHRIKGRSKRLIALEKWIEGRAIHKIQLAGVTKQLTDTILRRHPNIQPLCIRVLPNDLQPAGNGGKRYIANPLRLAVVGILEQRKNQEFTLRLVRSLSGTEWRLYLYGVGPQQRALLELVKELGLMEKVRFRGWAQREKIWPNVDLLLTPSIHEGMSNAVLEAVAAGVPVLASDIPAHRGILPPGQLLPLNDAKQWRAALDDILAAPQLKLSIMDENQRQSASHLQFDWDAEVVRMILADGR